MENPYWENIQKIAEKQRNKGIKCYGQGLEDNQSLNTEETITYLQEELIDGLMYCEHVKSKLNSVNGMSVNQYQVAALRTASGMSEEYPRILNGVLGLVGESGECVDMVKKHLFQGHELDKEHMVKELGDVAWYLAISAHALGYDLETILKMNIDKLMSRYPDGFDCDKSINRKKGDI